MAEPTKASAAAQPGATVVAAAVPTLAPAPSQTSEDRERSGPAAFCALARRPATRRWPSTNQRYLGECVEVIWDVQGEVSAFRITANGADVWANAPSGGSARHCPVTIGNLAYAIEATGPNGTARQEARVEMH